MIERYTPLDYRLKHGLGVCVLSPGEDDGLKDLGELLCESFNRQAKEKWMEDNKKVDIYVSQI